MAGKTKSAKKAATNGKDGGLLFPGKLIPLTVYGCWLLGDWTDLSEKDGYYSFDPEEDGGTVIWNSRDENGKVCGKTPIGGLPDGWACEFLVHNATNCAASFVGLKADVERAASLEKQSSDADNRLGEMLHALD